MIYKAVAVRLKKIDIIIFKKFKLRFPKKQWIFYKWFL